jgi:hypothetical protein
MAPQHGRPPAALRALVVAGYLSSLGLKDRADFLRVWLNSALPALAARLSPIALMVVLTVIFVPTGNLLLFCLLLLHGNLIHPRRLRLLQLLIEVLVLLCHIILLTKSCVQPRKNTGFRDTLSFGSKIRFIMRTRVTSVRIALRPNPALNRTRGMRLSP